MHHTYRLPGGFFIYEEGGDEKILFADENVINLFECETFEEFLEYTGGSFKGMVYEEDLHKIENEITAQTMFGEKRHDYVRYRIKTKKGDVKYIEDFGHLLQREQRPKSIMNSLKRSAARGRRDIISASPSQWRKPGN